MRAVLGHELKDGGNGLADEISRETDGNPFFVGEIVRHLDEAGRCPGDAGLALTLRRRRPAAEHPRGGEEPGRAPRRGDQLAALDRRRHRPRLRPRTARAGGRSRARTSCSDRSTAPSGPPCSRREGSRAGSASPTASSTTPSTRRSARPARPQNTSASPKRSRTSWARTPASARSSSPSTGCGAPRPQQAAEGRPATASSPGSSALEALAPEEALGLVPARSRPPRRDCPRSTRASAATS